MDSQDRPPSSQDLDLRNTTLRPSRIIALIPSPKTYANTVRTRLVERPPTHLVLPLIDGFMVERAPCGSDGVLCGE